MAKDPAFLFYYQDFLVGTDEFTNEEVGAYIRCLCIQAAKGGISSNHMIKICQTHEIHMKITKKFIFENSEEFGGIYKNARLAEEIDKRRSYCESRSNNKKGKRHMKNISKSYDSHMENENNNVLITKSKAYAPEENFSNQNGAINRNQPIVNFKAQGEILLAERLARHQREADDDRKKNNPEQT